MSFQSTVNVYNALGIVGDIAFADGGVRAIGATLNSSGTANLFGNAFTFTASATAEPSGAAPNGAVCTVGGTGLFAGILSNPKQNALFGTTGNPLGATLALPDNTVGQLLQRGYMYVNLPGPANPGDLVTFDTATGNLNSIVAQTQFTASASTTTLTVTAVAQGTIAVGQLITGVNVTPGTRITALGSGLGGTGTYTINVSQTASSGAVTAVNVPAPAFSGTATFATNVMTVATVVSGSLEIGQQIFGAGVPDNTVITALGTGVGGTGTYTLNQTVGTITPAIAVTGPTNVLVPNTVVERYVADTAGGVAVIKLSN